MAARLPFLKFFPADWQADPGLRSCSLAARGLWFEMLCLMHTSTHRGELLVPGGLSPLPTPRLARLVGAEVGEVETLLDELRASRVFDESDGVIVSRKMVRDEQQRQQGVENGRKGGNPLLRGRKGLVGGLTPQPTPGISDEPTPRVLDSRLNTPLPPNGGSEAGSASPPAADPKSRRRTKVGATEPPEFARFYAAYPRKAKRPYAARAFAKLNPDADLVAVILAKLEQFKACPKWAEEDGRFVPYPATWLNGRCWEDDVPGGRPPADAAAAAQRTAENLADSARHAPPANWRQHSGGNQCSQVNTPPVSTGSPRSGDLPPGGPCATPTPTTRQEAVNGVR